MKYLVVYSSQGGNTRKLAEEVFRQLPDENKDIFPVKEVPEPAGYDVICVGFWFKGGEPDPDSRQYLRKCASGKVFLFASHGAANDSDHVTMGMNKAEELVGGAEVIGTFSCQGEVPAKVIETAANKNPQPPWLKDAEAAKGHPDTSDFMALADAMIKAGLKTPGKDSGKGPIITEAPPVLG